ncbi:MAG: DUF2911 domain-containing protein [Gemmatimonadales bacterium]
MIRLLFLPTLLLLLTGLTAFVLTGVALVPTTLALGPCLRDFTSPFWEERASPLSSTTFDVGDGAVRVCYGRPSARERVVFGELVRYRQLWRTGANEPTRLYTNRAIDVAGVRLVPGRYSLYTIPDTNAWRVFITESVTYWGNDLLSGARDKDVGVGIVPADTTADYIETFTISTESADDSVLMVLEWERTRVAVGVRAVRR